MPAENRPRDENAGDPAERRRYEDAVLAALDFEPALEPDVVGRLRSWTAEVDRQGRRTRHRRAFRPAHRLAFRPVLHAVLARTIYRSGAKLHPRTY